MAKATLGTANGGVTHGMAEANQDIGRETHGMAEATPGIANRWET